MRVFLFIFISSVLIACNQPPKPTTYRNAPSELINKHLIATDAAANADALRKRHYND
jgi:hypothetical protein